MATIAANAIAATTPSFEAMRILPRGSVIANGNVCCLLTHVEQPEALFMNGS